MARGRRKKHPWWWLAVVVLVAPAGFYLWRSEAATSPIQAPRKTAVVVRGSLEQTVIATGVVRPVVGAEIQVGSRISGTVAELPVQVGDRVEAGELLALLDVTALEAAADQARADLALDRARLALAESTLKRRQRLAESGIVAVEELETARRDLDVERARVAASEARLRAAEIRLGYGRITAPIRGVVAEVTTREGETVAADFAAPTFVTLIDLERLEVLAYVDETDVGRVFVGQAASFTVDTYPEAEFIATVSAVEPKAVLEGNVVNYVARLTLAPRPASEDGNERILRPEMTAHVRLQTGQREDVLTLPRGALRRRDGRPYAVVERAAEWVEQEVRTGFRTESRIEISSGLREGERVALHLD